MVSPLSLLKQNWSKRELQKQISLHLSKTFLASNNSNWLSVSSVKLLKSLSLHNSCITRSVVDCSYIPDLRGRESIWGCYDERNAFICARSLFVSKVDILIFNH